MRATNYDMEIDGYKATLRRHVLPPTRWTFTAPGLFKDSYVQFEIEGDDKHVKSEAKAALKCLIVAYKHSDALKNAYDQLKIDVIQKFGSPEKKRKK